MEPAALTGRERVVGNQQKRVLKNFPAPLAGKKSRPYVAAR
jgi:hypothetical protein